MAAEEASRISDSRTVSGETFRQKDWRMYHILNLVLYDKFLEIIDMLSGQKTERAIAHMIVFKSSFFCKRCLKGGWFHPQI